MDRNYHTMLATKDICILASLLNKDFVVGLTNLTLDPEMISQPELVKHLIQSLERRSLIRYDLDRTLWIDPRIRTAMDIISNPQRFHIIKEQGQGSVRSTKYIYYGNETRVELSQDKLMDHYDISLYKTEKPETFYEQIEKTYLEDRISVSKESMMLEELLLAKEYIQDFREDKGSLYLSSLIKEQSSLQVILDILKGRGDSLIVRDYERKGFRLSLDKSSILLKLNNTSVKLRCDDNVVVDIEIFGT